MARKNIPTSGYDAIEIRAMITSSKMEFPKKWNRIKNITSVNSLLSMDPSSLWNDRLLIVV